MTGMIKLIVPPDRFSCIDYFLEKVDELSKPITGIKLTAAAYKRMTKDPYLEWVKTHTDNGTLHEDWFGDEITLDGKYYPPLHFSLLMHADGSAVVIHIDDCDDHVFDFDGKDYNVEIDF